MKRVIAQSVNCVKGWFLTNPILFFKKDAAYPDNPEDIVYRLNQLMVQNEYFKDPNLTIEKLCRATNTNRSYVSRAIHRMYGTHFCEWVNLYRIEAAKKFIKECMENRLDLEDLAMACGFNSARSFSRVFKAKEFCTPRQYFHKIQEHKDYTKYL
ncbi:MAG: helix-turn-helix transcriptional regulator [Bacteroidales bacterium]|nr:helix-turn-helix transcriptional regulator [Bacteroidales bacterium]